MSTFSSGETFHLLIFNAFSDTVCVVFVVLIFFFSNLPSSTIASLEHISVNKFSANKCMVKNSVWERQPLRCVTLEVEPLASGTWHSEAMQSKNDDQYSSPFVCQSIINPVNLLTKTLTMSSQTIHMMESG